ncbi:MAG: hypothetical protein MJY62_02080 [Bacteroidales bacterium]|nr:hypothetical protein [Bacteroidales bacterium]
MRLHIRILTALVALFVCGIPVGAQFYSMGADPASLRWYQKESEHFKVVYPCGTDSLASKYLRSLERYFPYAGRSTGFGLREGGKKFPVLLHTRANISNGSVAWAPSRMELFTNPSTDKYEALPWIDMLTIHEQRHMFQMQFGQSHVFRPFGYIFGEMWCGAMAGLYAEPMWLEGDAVVAETALSSSGRGRSAYFLNYYMAAFDSGDMRTFQKWKTGEQGKYSPDIYALGYMTISGYRVKYDCPDIMRRYLETASRKPYIIWRNLYISKPLSGRNVSNTFPEIAAWYRDMWREEMLRRAPFMEYEQIVSTPRFYTEYSNLTLPGGKLHATATSLSSAASLVLIDSAGVHRRCPSAADAYYSVSDGNKLFWSENVSSLRWELGGSSKIGMLDTEKGRSGKFITGGGKLYYSPSCNESAGLVAVSEHTPAGTTVLAVIDSGNGKPIREISLPDWQQVYEMTWGADSLIYASILGDGGFGLYCINPFEESSFREILPPRPVSIERPQYRDGSLYFGSDLGGVQELYELELGSGRLFRRSSTKYGSSSFVFGDGYLYFSRHDAAGKLVCRTPLADLPKVEVVWGDEYKWKVADCLSAQEAALSGVDTITYKSETQIPVGEPRRYRKAGHLFRLHSWMPLYADVSSISSSSLDISDLSATLGATAIFQNTLGTFIGTVGYSAHPDAFNPAARWRHGAHLTLTYKGWVPVLEAEVHFNDRAAFEYIPANVHTPATTENGFYLSSGYMRNYLTGTPNVNATLRTYVPLNFSSGGWNRGVVPSVSLSLGNDRYYRGIVDLMHYTDISGKGNSFNAVAGISGDRFVPEADLSASLRGYIIRNMAAHGIYPKFGVALEGGMRTSLVLGDIVSKNWYGYAYMYLPGFRETHGIRLSSTVQGLISGGQINSILVNNLPRGLSKDTALLFETPSGKGEISSLLSFQYAWPVNGSFLNFGSGALSVKRILISPFFDYFCGKNFSGSMYSAGGSLSITTGSLLWFSSSELTIGLVACYNGGRALDDYLSRGRRVSSHFYIGPTFSASF